MKISKKLHMRFEIITCRLSDSNFRICGIHKYKHSNNIKTVAPFSLLLSFSIDVYCFTVLLGSKIGGFQKKKASYIQVEWIDLTYLGSSNLYHNHLFSLLFHQTAQLLYSRPNFAIWCKAYFGKTHITTTNRVL